MYVYVTATAGNLYDMLNFNSSDTVTLHITAKITDFCRDELEGFDNDRTRNIIRITDNIPINAIGFVYEGQEYYATLSNTVPINPTEIINQILANLTIEFYKELTSAKNPTFDIPYGVITNISIVKDDSDINFQDSTTHHIEKSDVVSLRIYFPEYSELNQEGTPESNFSIIDTKYILSNHSAGPTGVQDGLKNLPKILHYLERNLFLNELCDSMIIIKAQIQNSEYPRNIIQNQYAVFNGFSYTYFYESKEGEFVLPNNEFPTDGDICDALEDHPIETSDSKILFSNIALLRYACFKWQLNYLSNLIAYSKPARYSDTTYYILRIDFQNNKIKSIQLIPDIKESREWRLWKQLCNDK